MTSNFYSAIHKILIENPDKTFIKWPNPDGDDIYFSGQDILQGVAFVCKSLQLKKINQGEKVLIALPFSFELICAILGIMAYGSIAVLPPSNTRGFSLFRLLWENSIRGVYIKNPQNYIKILLSIIRIKTLSHDTALQQIDYFKPMEVQSGQSALISFTSGSTGKPKAVNRSHQILKSQHLALKESFPTSPRQQDFPLFPNILLHNLSLGITTLIPDIPEMNIQKIDPIKIIAQILDEGIDSLTGNVHYFKILTTYLEKEKIFLPNVKKLGIGGSPVPEFLPHLLQKYFGNAAIYIIYGATQAEPISVRKVSKERKNPARGYNVGTVHPGIHLRIKPSGLGIENNIPERTGLIEVSGKHVVTDDKNTWLNTGDYGYLNDTGELYLTARAGNEGAVEGYTHYQLEHVMSNVPGVNHVAAIYQPGGFKIFFEGKTPVAHIRDALARHFPLNIVNTIENIPKMPLDNRHYSKIIYKNLCTPNLKK